MEYDRGKVASELYLRRGSMAAGRRATINTALGGKDLRAQILELLELDAGQVVLDVGCGAGLHLGAINVALGGSGAVGLDFVFDALVEARACGAPLVQADGQELPIASESIDRLTCNYAAYYLRDIGEAAAEWMRVLRPGAVIVCTGPAAKTNQELYAFHRRATGHGPSDADLMALGFVSGSLAEALCSSGFVDLKYAEFTNPIRFGDAKTLLDYWCNTSLFARTADATREQGEVALKDVEFPFIINKQTDIVCARKP